MPDSLTLKEEQILTFPKPFFERASDYTALAEALSVRRAYLIFPCLGGDITCRFDVIV